MARNLHTVTYSYSSSGEAYNNYLARTNRTRLVQVLPCWSYLHLLLYYLVLLTHDKNNLSTYRNSPEETYLTLNAITNALERLTLPRRRGRRTTKTNALEWLFKGKTLRVSMDYYGSLPLPVLRDHDRSNQKLNQALERRTVKQALERHYLQNLLF